MFLFLVSLHRKRVLINLSNLSSEQSDYAFLNNLRQNLHSVNSQVSDHEISLTEVAESDILRCIDALMSLQQSATNDIIKKTKARLLRIWQDEVSCTADMVIVDPEELHGLGDSQCRLGGGSYGEVYRCTFLSTLVAVKVFKESDKRSWIWKNALSEVSTWKGLKHENIVLLTGLTVFNGMLCAVSEFYDEDLDKFRRRYEKEAPDDYRACALSYLCQAAKGLRIMHNLHFFVHRDIKPKNILLKEDGRAVIADFGFSHSLWEDSEYSRSTWGTDYYKAPEMYDSNIKGFPVDVYAFGITMYEVLLRRDPYGTDFTKEKVRKGHRPTFVGANETLQSLIEKCWNHDPSTRPTMMSVYEELKKSYVESLIPGENQVCKYVSSFWLKSFGDSAIDRVSFSKLSAALPQNKDEKRKEALWRKRKLALGVPSPIPTDFKVDIHTFFNCCCWFGNFLDPDGLKDFRGFSDDSGYDFEWFRFTPVDWRVPGFNLRSYSEQNGDCFMIQPSTELPLTEPFTIIIAHRGEVKKFPIERNLETFKLFVNMSFEGGKTINVRDCQDLPDLVNSIMNSSEWIPYPFASSLPQS